MPTLAPKLPYTHPFAGGYPRIGGQPLPTDPDAIDYLERVKSADGGAAVEVGVAMAVDAFIKGCKADSAGYAGDPTRTVWDALQACCIMCGARTISGALVPLVGDAPTAYPQPVNFVSADYDRSSGLKGDGSTKYLDSNRANDADGQDDQHISLYLSAAPTNNAYGMGAGANVAGTSNIVLIATSGKAFARSRSASDDGGITTSLVNGLYGSTRSEAGSFDSYAAGITRNTSYVSEAPLADNIHVFRTNSNTPTDARLAFYSIGSAIPDLAALDNRVSTLVTAIGAAI